MKATHQLLAKRVPLSVPQPGHQRLSTRIRGQEGAEDGRLYGDVVVRQNSNEFPEHPTQLRQGVTGTHTTNDADTESFYLMLATNGGGTIAVTMTMADWEYKRCYKLFV